jgi:S1-C subfamily serine protease
MYSSVHTLCRRSISFIAIVLLSILITAVFTVYADEERSLEEITQENQLLRTQIANLEAEIESIDAFITTERNKEIPPGTVEIEQAEYDRLYEEIEELRSKVGDPLTKETQLTKDLIAARTALLIGKAKEFEIGSERTVSGFPASRIEEVREVADGLRDSVLLFSQTSEISSGSWESGIATAFLIGPELAVTNSHNVRGTDGTLNSGQIILITFQGNPIKASLVSDNPDADIALLRLEKPLSLPALKWANSGSISEGDPMFTIGHPGRMGSWVTNIGLIEKVQGEGTYPQLHFSAPCMKGCSGSPIFNMDGDVIGVLFGGTVESKDLPLQLHTSLRFLKAENGLGTLAQDASSLVSQFLLEEGAN